MKVFIILLICTATQLVISDTSEEHEGISNMINRYEKMETHLQKSFDLLFRNFTSASAQYKQKIVYMCDRDCQEDNRYEYGLTSAFLISVLAEKRFAVKSTSGFSLFHFYDVRNYSWKLDMAAIINKPGQFFLQPSSNKNEQESKKYLLEKDLQTMDFSLHSEKDFVLVSGENNWIQDLRRNPLSSRKMPWLYSAHACDVNRLIHAGLFQTPRVFYKNLTGHIQQEVGHNKLVCIHTNEKELVKKSTIVEFLRRILHGDSKYRIFLSNTNSKEIFDLQKPGEKYFDDHVINLDIDDLYKSFKYSDNERHNFNRFKNFVNTHILKLCDVLVTSDSAVGIFAAHLRVNSDNLFCYGKGLIYKCTRDLIAGSFSHRKHDLVGVDVRYVRKIFA